MFIFAIFSIIHKITSSKFILLVVVINLVLISHPNFYKSNSIFVEADSSSSITDTSHVYIVSDKALSYLKNSLSSYKCGAVLSYFASKSVDSASAQAKLDGFSSNGGAVFDCTSALDYWNYELLPPQLTDKNGQQSIDAIRKQLDHGLRYGGSASGVKLRDWITNLPDHELVTLSTYDTNVGKVIRNNNEDTYNAMVDKLDFLAEEQEETKKLGKIDDAETADDHVHVAASTGDGDTGDNDYEGDEINSHEESITEDEVIAIVTELETNDKVFVYACLGFVILVLLLLIVYTTLFCCQHFRKHTEKYKIGSQEEITQKEKEIGKIGENKKLATKVKSERK